MVRHHFPDCVYDVKGRCLLSLFLHLSGFTFLRLQGFASGGQQRQRGRRQGELSVPGVRQRLALASAEAGRLWVALLRVLAEAADSPGGKGLGAHHAAQAPAPRPARHQVVQPPALREGGAGGPAPGGRGAARERPPPWPSRSPPGLHAPFGFHVLQFRGGEPAPLGSPVLGAWLGFDGNAASQGIVFCWEAQCVFWGVRVPKEEKVGDLSQTELEHLFLQQHPLRQIPQQ